MPTIAIITCYKYPDYVRAKVLRSAVRMLSDTQPLVVKNNHKGLLRYPETVIRLIWLRIFKNPDIYLVTFRGYEILPLVVVVALGKQIIFDEFINPLEWAVYEHRKIKENGLTHKILRFFYRACLKRTATILTDTESHAEYSATLMNLPGSKYVTLPVSTDEATFSAQDYKPSEEFNVLYYGSMLPLHGLDLVVEAAIKLKDEPAINFLLVGGKQQTEAMVAKAQQQGARITFKKRVPFEELPVLARQASLCLSGPFGNTLQSQMVITGKTFQFLCAGLPTLVGETKEHGLLKDQVNCLAVPQGDSQAIAAKIKWAYENQSKLAEIGRAGRETYLKHYSNEIVVSKLSALLKAENK